MSDIEEQVKKIIVDHLGIEESKVKLNRGNYIFNLNNYNYSWVFFRIKISSHFWDKIEITANGLTLLKELDPLTSAENASNTSSLNDDELVTLNNLLDKLRTDE